MAPSLSSTFTLRHPRFLSTSPQHPTYSLPSTPPTSNITPTTTTSNIHLAPSTNLDPFSSTTFPNIRLNAYSTTRKSEETLTNISSAGPDMDLKTTYGSPAAILKTLKHSTITSTTSKRPQANDISLLLILINFLPFNIAYGMLFPTGFYRSRARILRTFIFFIFIFFISYHSLFLFPWMWVSVRLGLTAACTRITS